MKYNTILHSYKRQTYSTCFPPTFGPPYIYIYIYIYISAFRNTDIHICEGKTCLGYDSSSIPTLKKASYCTRKVGGTHNKSRHKYVKFIKRVSGMNLYLSRQKWTINETLIFFKIFPLAFTHFPSDFSNVKVPCGIWCDMLNLRSFFNVFAILKFYTRDNSFNISHGAKSFI